MARPDAFHLAWPLAAGLALQHASLAWAAAAAAAVALIYPPAAVAVQPPAMPLLAAAVHSAAPAVQSPAFATRLMLQQSCGLLSALARVALAAAAAVEVGLAVGLDLALALALAQAVPFAPAWLLGALLAVAPPWAGRMQLTLWAARQVAVPL